MTGIVLGIEAMETRQAKQNRDVSEPKGRVQVDITVARRLLTVRAAASYLGISYWSARDLVLFGKVPSVRFPCPRSDGKLFRRMLIDIQDLNDFISENKTRADP